VKGPEDINITAEEVGIITGTERSQESINMVTAGAVVIIMQERTGDVNIIYTGEIKNWNTAEETVIRAGTEEEEGEVSGVPDG
jgi:hypothetical protein